MTHADRLRQAHAAFELGSLLDELPRAEALVLARALYLMQFGPRP